jgi:hypothetical protein
MKTYTHAWMATAGAAAVIGLAAPAWAACTGASPSWTSTPDYSSLSSCVTQAKDGDTIRVSSGTVTYSQGITIAKPLSIIGAGPSATVINAAGAVVFTINMPKAGNVRLSAMGFTGTGGSTQLETTVINMRGILDTVRLDNLNFTDIQQHAVYVGLWDAIPQHPKILFDHINYRSSLTSGFQRFLKLLGNNNTWSLDDRYGSDFYVFIEDSSFIWTGVANSNSGVTDTEHGARMVVRNNLIQGGGVQVHDTGSTPAAKGQRTTEVYNNTFSCTIPGCSNIPAIGIRGGGWVVHNNVFGSGFWTPGFPQIYRATVGAGYLGASCTGAVISVCNTPTYYHCSGGDKRACGFPGDSTCSGMGSCVITASGPSDCPAQFPFILSLDRVNGGSGASGYPCRHQSGWGKESADGQTQSPSPVYWWGNKNASGSTVSLNHDVSPWFLADRDYCNRNPSTACGAKAAWTYAPFTYPHPLQSGTSVQTDVVAPSGLRVQ